MTTASPSIRAAMRTTSSTTNAAPASARWPAGAVKTGISTAKGHRTRTSSKNISRMGAFWSHHFPDDQKYYKFANKAYLDWAKEVGFIGSTEPIVLQVYSEILQKFRNAARGHGDIQPPERERARIEAYFDPMPIWYPPFEESMIDLDSYPMACDHAAGRCRCTIRGARTMRGCAKSQAPISCI